jgi:N-methylhydantoinase A
LAHPLGIAPERAAEAVHEIANATMAGAIHAVSVQRGIDPRRYVLVTSGGAGPLHAPRIAERFGLTTVVVPPACGVASALGLLAADLRTDRTRTVFIDDANVSSAVLVSRFAELEREAASELGYPNDDVTYRRSVAVRYRGQSHELDVPLARGIADDGALQHLRHEFHRRHREAFGVGSGGPIEIVNLRVRATVAVPHARFVRPSRADGEGTSVTRRAWFAELGGYVDTPVLRLSDCRPGVTVPGPALVDAPESTILVPPGWQATVEDTGAVLLTRAT